MSLCGQQTRGGQVTAFPAFDLAAFEAATGQHRQELARKLDQTCRETGFLVLSGHGVAENVITNIDAAVLRFFSQKPEEKQKVAAPYSGYPYGYLGPGTEALAASRGQKTPPDLKESFNGGPLAVPPSERDPDALAFCYAATLWPDTPGFREAWQAYYRAMEELARRFMAAFAEALDLAPDFFEPFISEPISALRALHYPAQVTPPAADQMRAGAHSDYGSLTILKPQVGSTGLQIEMPDGKWRDVPAPEGCFVINIGDLMARWTNDRWVSTLHRVTNAGRDQSRMSLAFFHQPNWHAMIENLTDAPAKYQGVASGPYLMEKFRATAS